jgi:hypothetical protein
MKLSSAETAKNDCPPQVKKLEKSIIRMVEFLHSPGT